ncbi:hypothetical protein ACMDB5_02510 [Flavobacterium sp. W1B]|uniref:hypothetical protein n=1 Tax=Flavobacterium sp. W1B TaxID=3394146 RepID=UPI0039BCDE41
MSTKNTFSEKFNFFRNLRNKRSRVNLSENDLINPRLGLDATDEKDLKKQSNSLQFLMYSKENDTLFI